METAAADAEVVVIGAGPAATLFLAAMGACRPTAGRRRLAVVAPDEVDGPGVPYRTADPRHRMNVPAGQLSVRADAPDDFVTWAQREGAPVTAGSFVPRRLYGEYLAWAWCTWASAFDVGRFREAATALRPVVGGVEVRTARGAVLRARHAVLAVGPGAGTPPFEVADEVRADGGFVADPWAPAGLAGLEGARRVVLVGTGLTAVDAALTLSAARGVEEIVAVSPSGALPCAHADGPTAAALAVPPPPEPLTARTLLRWVHGACRDEPNGWRAVLDALRFDLGPLWSRLAPAERGRLARLVGSRWTRHRHRMAPAVHAEVEALVAAGRLRVQRGRVRRIRSAGEAVRVELAGGRSDGACPPLLEAEAVVDCSGLPPLSRLADPLVRRLLDDGVLVPDPLGLGVLTDAQGRAVGGTGTPSHVVSVLGALRRGTELEATAVPDLRRQAVALARRLTGHPASPCCPPCASPSCAAMDGRSPGGRDR